MNIKTAKQTNIVDFLRKMGLNPSPRPGGDAFFLSPLHDERTPSFHVDESGTKWYDFGIGKGGDILDLVGAIYHTDISSSLRILEEGGARPVPVGSNASTTTVKNHITDITESEICNSLLKYSRERGISDQVITTYCVQVNYSLGEKKYFAIGFRNNIGGYEIRTKFHKMVIGKKDVTLVSDLIDCPMFVFEGFFDFLSAVQLGWFNPMEQNAVVLNSTAMIHKSFFFLSKAKRIYCMLDNDPSGRQATKQIQERFDDVVDCSHIYSGYNDLNAYLIR